MRVPIGGQAFSGSAAIFDRRLGEPALRVLWPISRSRPPAPLRTGKTAQPSSLSSRARGHSSCPFPASLYPQSCLAVLLPAGPARNLACPALPRRAPTRFMYVYISARAYAARMQLSSQLGARTCPAEFQPPFSAVLARSNDRDPSRVRCVSRMRPAPKSAIASCCLGQPTLPMPSLQHNSDAAYAPMPMHLPPEIWGPPAWAHPSRPCTLALRGASAATSPAPPANHTARLAHPDRAIVPSTTRRPAQGVMLCRAYVHALDSRRAVTVHRPYFAGSSALAARSMCIGGGPFYVGGRGGWI